jgi:hypothetical protein
MSDWIEIYRPDYTNYIRPDYCNILDSALLLSNIDVNSELGMFLKENQSDVDLKLCVIGKFGIKWSLDPEITPERRLFYSKQRLIDIVDNDDKTQDLKNLIKKYCELCKAIYHSEVVFTSPNIRVEDPSDYSKVYVKMTELIQWADLRNILVSNELNLLYFPVKKEGVKKVPHGNTEINTKNKAEVLGAALAVLSKWPDECKHKNGNFAASKIAEKIEAEARLFWPDKDRAPLKVETMAEHINEWLKKVGGLKD